MNWKTKIADTVLVLGCFIALAFAFFNLAPSRLEFKEQLGIFFLSPERWTWYLSKPAVAAQIIGDWLTQFLYHRTFGIILILLLLALLWCGTWKLLRMLGAGRSAAALAMLPAAAASASLIYLNWPISAAVGLTFSIWAAVRKWKPWQYCLVIPVCFILNGASALYIAFPALVLYRKQFTKTLIFVLAGAAVAILLGRAYNLTFFQTLSWPVPLDYIVPGRLLALALPLSLLLAVLLAPVDPVRWAGYSLSAFAVAASIFSMSDQTIENTVRIGTHAYRGEWSHVRRMALSDKTGGRIFIYYANLSYAIEDRLGDELFNHRQNGSRSLFLPMGRYDGYLSIFFNIDGLIETGDISEAIDCALLGQTIMPGQYSTRMLRYLSEIAVITHDYSVAEKYLDVLCKTRFHAQWAQNLKTCIETDSIPERYLKLRAKTAKTDRLYPQEEPETALRTIAELNPSNRTAIDYLLCSCLLDKRGGTFLGLYEKYWLNRLDRIYPIPKAYQEALLVNATSLEDIRAMAEYYHISDDVRTNFSHFLQDKERANGKVGDLYEYRGTYWYYIISTKLTKDE